MSSSRERKAFLGNKNLFIFSFLLGMILRAGGGLWGPWVCSHLGLGAVFSVTASHRFGFTTTFCYRKNQTINLLILLNYFKDTLAYS